MRSRELVSAAGETDGLGVGDAFVAAGEAAGAGCTLSGRKVPLSGRGSAEGCRSVAAARGASLGCEPPMMAAAGIAGRTGLVADPGAASDIAGFAAPFAAVASSGAFVSVEGAGAS